MLFYLTMKSKIYLLISAFILVNIHSQKLTAKFAFSWFEGHCQHSKNSNQIAKKEPGGCDTDKLALWDHQSFTIHGLWPDRQDPYNGSKFGKFDLKIIQDNSQLHEDMKNYWPPQSRRNTDKYFLWQHEWNGHGHKYAYLIRNIQSKRFTQNNQTIQNRQLQFAFFQDTVNFYKKMSGTKNFPSNTFDKKKFASIFKIKEDQFTISCVTSTRKGQYFTTVREIKVCLEITQTQLKIVDCTAKLNFGCLNGAKVFTLPGWAIRNQKRVFNDQQKNQL